MKKISIGFAVAALLLSTFATGSTYTGTVTTIQVTNSGASPTRLSVSGKLRTSPCADKSWFAYENADASIGKIWTALLTTAYASGKTVVVYGNNTCDQWGIEGVNTIEVQ